MRILRPIIVVGMVCLFVLMATTLPAATKMPSFALADVVSGETINSQSFKGKALLVTFFATWCPPCIEEVPTLIKMHKQYKDKQFSVIGLSVDIGDSRAVTKLIKKKSINYPVMMADSRTIEKFGGIYTVPVSFLVNKRGNVVKKYDGYIPHSVLVRDLKKIL